MALAWGLYLSKDIHSKETDEGERCRPCLRPRPLFRVVLCMTTYPSCLHPKQSVVFEGLLCLCCIRPFFACEATLAVHAMPPHNQALLSTLCAIGDQENH